MERFTNRHNRFYYLPEISHYSYFLTNYFYLCLCFCCLNGVLVYDFLYLTLSKEWEARELRESLREHFGNCPILDIRRNDGRARSRSAGSSSSERSSATLNSPGFNSPRRRKRNQAFSFG